ncbi:MAG: glycosyltransferase [Lachnospiraceae bacterium]|nr:glycosyltransferase [Lachnospiraceae bacterium]
MRILHINSVCGVTGTGRIVTDLYREAAERGYECRVAYGEHKYKNVSDHMETMKIGSLRGNQLHALYTRLFDMQGFGSRRATEKFLKEVTRYEPDVVHLHNLHGYYIHIGLLFRYLKERNIKVVWTLHDCWPFTGHCVHFQNAGCEKWKEGCYHCPLKRQYPASMWADCSQKNYLRKRELFTGLQDMTILVPSAWMKERVRQSFLKDYETKIVYNGIDLNTYHPTPGSFRQKHGLERKFIVLGVANVWVERKGLDIFLELAKRLGGEYQIVLVGLTEEQIAGLPKGVLGLPRTDTAAKLAEIYTAADVFVNPGREETFGLTVAEAMACGTWPVVYEGTACAEVVERGTGQIVTGGLEELAEAVRVYRERGPMENIEKFAAFFSIERFGREVLAAYG